MTVSAVTPVIEYLGNGATVTFAVPFRFLAAEDLRVVRSVGDTDTLLRLTTDYSVAGADEQSGGSITLVAAPAIGATLNIRRVTPPVQSMDLRTGDNFPADSLERALDRAMMIAQEIAVDGLAGVEEASQRASQAATSAAASAASADADAAAALSAKTSAQSFAADTEVDADRAELAANAAATTANLYATTAAGIAATTNGQYFLVVGSGATYATLYKNVAGVATSQNLTLPSASAIPELIIGGTKNLFDGAAITSGYEIYADGTPQAQANSVVSDFIPVRGMESITISGLQANPGFNRYAAFYADDQTTVIDTFNMPDGTNGISVDVPSGSIWLRFSPRQRYAHANDFSTAQVEEGSSATLYEEYRPRIRFINDTTVDAVKLVVTGNRNLFDMVGVTEDFEVYADGTLQPQGDSSISPLIYIFGEDRITVSGLAANPGFSRYYRFLEEDKATVAGTGQIEDGENGKTITVPADAVWFQFSPKQRYAGASSYANVQVEGGAGATEYESFTPRVISINGIPIKGQSPEVEDRIAGKHYLLFGDSITETGDVDGGDYRWPAQTAPGFPRANWPDYAMPLLGPQSVFSYARSGAHYSSRTGLLTFQKFEEQLAQAIADGRTPDVVIVALGTNDFGNVPTQILGDYDTAIGKSIVALDLQISIEAARHGFYTIRDTWPNAVCFVVLPLQRADFTPEQMEDWADLIARMAGRYGFTVIDGFRESGIVHDFEVVSGAGQDLSDGIHPDPSGQQKEGELIEARVRARLG